MTSAREELEDALKSVAKRFVDRHIEELRRRLEESLLRRKEIH